jgi:hypothetical protein
MGGVNLIKIHFKQIYKCHNDSPAQLIYANKNVKRKRKMHVKFWMKFFQETGSRKK